MCLSILVGHWKHMTIKQCFITKLGLKGFLNFIYLLEMIIFIVNVLGYKLYLLLLGSHHFEKWSFQALKEAAMFFNYYGDLSCWHNGCIVIKEFVS